MKWTVRRTYLIRRSVTYECDMPEEMDPEHLGKEHPAEFAVDLTRGGDPLTGWTAKVIGQSDEETEYDEDTLEVIARQSANVLPFKRRKP